MRHALLIVISICFFQNSQALRFDNACAAGDKLVIGAVGDVLLHGPLQKQGAKSGFESLWADITDFMQAPDMMYANFEGPAAAGVTKNGKQVKDPWPVFDGNVYSGYPLFNYPPAVIQDLKDSGVDILSTSNNHSLDRGTLGARKTIEAMDAIGMPYMGTRSDSNGDFHRITDQNGWRIAWIACTYGTNGIPDKEDLVLDCFDGRVDDLIADLKGDNDAVIVTPHWGDEYQLSPNNQQKKYARQWIDAGAHAVIGAHPHVPQTWEKRVTEDGREGLILYSLGNFVSNQSSTKKQSSLILYVGLSKSNGFTWVNGVRYLPLYMNRVNGLEAIAVNFVEKPTADQKASLKLLKDMYGEERIIEPGEEILTNAECF